MSIHEPSRGGTRGGKDQFTWKDVEVDKHRENYLANSLMAPVGRWQKGKDLTWYTKDSKVLGKKERLKLEMAAVKKVEEEAMARALGLKSSGSTMKSTEVLSKEEIAEICKRKDDDIELTHDRMKGVGYKSQKNMMMISNAASNDGVTKFEQDRLDGSNLTRLVLKTSSSDTHQRSVSTSSDHHQQQQPEQQQPTNNDNQDDDDDGVWITTTVSNKKKNKKRKKAKKETKNHGRRDDSEKHGKRRKSDKIRKIKKRKDKYSNNSSTSSSSNDSDNNRHWKTKRQRDMSERKRERHIDMKKRKRESSESSDEKERTDRKSYHDRGNETSSKKCKRERGDMRQSNDYGKERRYQEKDRTHRSPGQREYGRRRGRERDYSPEQKRRRPRHDTDSSN